jgi:beta-galactosidase GanA
VHPALPRLGGSNPQGEAIGFTSAFLTYRGRPWPAVAGEIHYARYPRPRWQEALSRMKACGVDIASTYVFWIHHEETQGVFDWSGDRDLRRFIECCAETGLFAIVRVGPFCHGEV